MDLFEEKPGDNAPEFSVSEIAGKVRRLIEGEMSFVRVRGEVGRVVHARSGHLYFDLKDEKSVLSCMTWKGQAPGMGTMPEEGMEVIAEGKMTASGMQSKFGLNAVHVAVAGEGALLAMLEKRKKKLAAEGLFDEGRKKALPYLPGIIGVITSPQGAVIRDILHRLRDRFPRKVLIWPVAVQGEKCAQEVAAGIRGFNALTPGGALPRPDLLIVARGGGSIEDLWGFNEEVVVRAVAESDIPLISAVGHETDTTLIDFVADRRAPTPTAAAEMAVPVRVDLMAWVSEQDARMSRAIGRGVTDRRQRLADLSRALPRADGLTADARQRLDRADEALERGLLRLVERRRGELSRLEFGLRPSVLKRGISQRKERLAGLSARVRSGPLKERVTRQAEDLNRIAPRLDRTYRAHLSGLSERLEGLERMRVSLGYKKTLERGYAVVRQQDAVVMEAGALKAGAVEIEFRDGRVSVGDGAQPKKKKAPNQGSLF